MTDRPRKKKDAYEASIAGDATVVHRDKLVSRPLAWVSLSMTMLAFAAAAGGYAEGAPLPVAAGVAAVGLGFIFLGLTRTVLRTVVTDHDLRIRWGLWGPTIPLSSVSEVSVRHDCSRVAMNEAISEPGAPGVEMMGPIHRPPVVDFLWTDEKGKARRMWLGAGDAEALAASIKKGMARTKVRVEVDSEEEVEEAVPEKSVKKRKKK